MPYKVEKRKNKWHVVNSDTGETVPGGDHASEPAAQAHMQTLAANAEPETLVKYVATTQSGAIIATGTVTTNAPAGVTWSNDITLNPVPEPLAKNDTGKQFFIPLAKVDARLHQVWGYGALEQEDNSDEIMDYATSKPLWEKWSQDTFARSGGKSYGNLRAMHQATAAGKLIKFETDDSRKGIWVGAEVIDPVEWKKVEAGVYTGFSVGGHYVRKWSDRGKMRYTAEPVELSLVDAPCIPGATFQMVKADGMEEALPFVDGKGENVLKAELPDSPDPAGTVADLPANMTTVKAAQPDVPLIVSPDNPPAGDALASRHVGVQELTEAANKFVQAFGVPESVAKLRKMADDLEATVKAEEEPKAEEKKEAEAETKEAEEEKKEVALDEGKPEAPAEKVTKIKVVKHQPAVIKVRKAAN